MNTQPIYEYYVYLNIHTYVHTNSIYSKSLKNGKFHFISRIYCLSTKKDLIK